MFKFIIFGLCLSAVAARPGYLHGHLDHYPLLHHHDHHHAHLPLVHHEPLHFAKVVHVPAAISHQSSTVIHTVPHHHHIVKPIVLPTYVHPAPIIKAYHPAPIVKAIHPITLPLAHYDPFHHHHHLHHFDPHFH